MDKPRFGVIENGVRREVDTPEEARRKECEKDAIAVLRDTLRGVRDRSSGRCVGVIIALAYDDGQAGSRRSETCMLPGLIGACELAKLSAMRVADTNEVPDAEPDPEENDE